MNDTFGQHGEFYNPKKITIGDYVNLFSQNDKSEIRIINKEYDLLFNYRIDYLQIASDGCMHDLCELCIERFDDPRTIIVDDTNYKGRIGIY